MTTFRLRSVHLACLGKGGGAWSKGASVVGAGGGGGGGDRGQKLTAAYKQVSTRDKFTENLVTETV